jgi:hypothetical protein
MEDNFIYALCVRKMKRKIKNNGRNGVWDKMFF